MSLPIFKKPTEARSLNMRAIRSTGNESTDGRLVSLLKSSSVRGWSLHPPGIFGHPDVVFARFRTVVFVDGCFWHGCPRCGHIPRTNRKYWRAKIEQNKRRDRKVTRELKKLNYRIVRLRECQLRKNSKLCLDKILRVLVHKLQGRTM